MSSCYLVIKEHTTPKGRIILGLLQLLGDVQPHLFECSPSLTIIIISFFVYFVNKKYKIILYFFNFFMVIFRIKYSLILNGYYMKFTACLKGVCVLISIIYRLLFVIYCMAYNSLLKHVL